MRKLAAEAKGADGLDARREMRITPLIRQYAEEATWLPPEWITACCYMPLHVIARGAFYAQHSVRRYYPGEYYMLVGTSGSGKGIAIDDIVGRFIEPVDANLILGKEFTPEGLLSELIHRPTGIVINDEIAVLLSKRDFQRDMPGVLTSMYNHIGDYRKSLKKESYHLPQPVLSLMLGAQPVLLSRLVGEEDFAKGFMARFLLWPGDEQPENPDARPNELLQEEIIFRLRLLYLYARIVQKPIEIKIDSEARKILRATIKELRLHENEDVGAYFGRMADHVYKMALVVALDRYVGTWLNTLSQLLTEEEILSIRDISNTYYLTTLTHLLEVDDVYSYTSKETTWKWTTDPPIYNPKKLKPPKGEERTKEEKEHIKIPQKGNKGSLPLKVLRISNESPVIDVKTAEEVKSILLSLTPKQTAILLDIGGSIDVKMLRRVLRAVEAIKFEEEGRWLFKRGDLLSKVGAHLKRIIPLIEWLVDRQVLIGVKPKQKPGRGPPTVMYQILRDPKNELEGIVDGWEDE